MKLFRVLVLAVALVAGGIAAYLALNMGQGNAAGARPWSSWLRRSSRRTFLSRPRISDRASVCRRITCAGKRWPDDAVNAAYIQKQTMPDAVAKLEGSVVRSPFVAGEPIRNVKLSRPESGFLSAILPSGKRAIAVRVSAQSTAGGFILPGDRVDVVQTISQQASPDMPAENVSRTILANIKVLAIDQTVSDKDGEKVVVGKTATLELDPVQVELVTSAEASGTLSLSLRSITDTDQVVGATEDKQSGTVRVFRAGRGRTTTTQ